MKYRLLIILYFVTVTACNNHATSEQKNRFSKTDSGYQNNKLKDVSKTVIKDELEETKSELTLEMIEHDSSIYVEYISEELKSYLNNNFSEWRIPSPDYWNLFWFNEYLSDSALVNYGHGDFNCDSVKDYALFLIDEQENFKFLILHGKDNSFEVMREEGGFKIPKPYDSGIIIDKPGESSYFSGDENTNEVMTVSIKCNSITRIDFERTAVTYFWDGNDYKVVQTGD